MVTIKEWKARGGKLPGEKGFDIEAVKKDVEVTKRKKIEKRKVSKAPKPITVGPSTPIDKKTLLTDTPQQIFDLNFTEEQVKGIKSAGGHLPKAIQEAVAAGEYNIVEDVSQSSQIQTTGLTSIGFSGGTLSGMFAKKIVAKGLKPVIGKIGKIIGKPATNTVTQKLSQNWLIKLITGANTKTITSLNPATGMETVRIITTNAGVSPTKIAAIITMGGIGAVGSKAWSDHLTVDNLIGSLDIAARDATEQAVWETDPVRKAELLALAKEAREMKKDVLDYSTWEQILRWTPLGVSAAAARIVASAPLTSHINDKINESILNQQTPEELQAEKDASFQAGLDITHAKSIANEKKIIALRAQAKDVTDEKEIAVVIKSIKFWEEKRERDEKSAREEAEWLGEYWLEYDILKDKADQNRRPSNLNFGLLG